MFPSTKGPWVHLFVHLPYLFIIFFSFTLWVTQIATAKLFYSFNLSTTDFLFYFYSFFVFILMERVLTTTSEIENLGKAKNIADKQRPV